MIQVVRKYRKRPVVIEAVQWDGSSKQRARIVTWARGAIEGIVTDQYELAIRTAEGEMRARAGDWIIKGIKGEFYPCKPDIFERIYELAEVTNEQ